MSKKIFDKTRVIIFLITIAALILVIVAACITLASDSASKEDNGSNTSSNTIDSADISNPNSESTDSQPHTADINQPRTSKGFLIENVDGVTYIGGVLIANKTYPLPSTYGSGLTPETEAAFAAMRQAAAADGIELNIVSGFRSYETQRWLYDSYVARDGQAAADTYSARPGFSEHQTGLAMDLNWVDTNFAYTPAGQWLNQNAWKYGFILRYPEGSEDIAGFVYEPWHFRYVGPELAAKLYNNGAWITLEEYFDIVSKYAE